MCSGGRVSSLLSAVASVSTPALPGPQALPFSLEEPLD